VAERNLKRIVDVMVYCLFVKMLNLDCFGSN